MSSQSNGESQQSSRISSPMNDESRTSSPEIWSPSEVHVHPPGDGTYKITDYNNHKLRVDLSSRQVDVNSRDIQRFRLNVLLYAMGQQINYKKEN